MPSSGRGDAAGRALAVGLGVYLAWTMATWLLEGLPRTLQRPDAIVARLTYTAIANLAIGVAFSGLAIAYARVRLNASISEFGLTSARRTVMTAPIGLAAGAAVYAIAGGASADPVVVLNLFAQVFPVTVAEVMVCWALIAGTLRAIARGLAGGAARAIAIMAAAIVAAGLFGVYHIAHSPPFNSLSMIAFLSAIGLLTSAVFLASRNVYATILFHNMMGVLGVSQALNEADRLSALSSIQPALIAMAGLSIVLLVVMAGAVARQSARR